jgi:hypothetical protein
VTCWMAVLFSERTDDLLDGDFVFGYFLCALKSLVIRMFVYVVGILFCPFCKSTILTLSRKYFVRSGPEAPLKSPTLRYCGGGFLNSHVAFGSVEMDMLLSHYHTSPQAFDVQPFILLSFVAFHPVPHCLIYREGIIYDSTL